MIIVPIFTHQLCTRSGDATADAICSLPALRQVLNGRDVSGEQGKTPEAAGDVRQLGGTSDAMPSRSKRLRNA
eukprot:scaffold84570_cov30-Tisochrysis_lutea.AAC.1